VLRSLSISKNAFRGFGNPRALEGNRRDVDRVRGEKLEIVRTRLEELLPGLKAINSRDLDYLCQDQVLPPPQKGRHSNLLVTQNLTRATMLATTTR
jgi:hypothetical protein